MKKLTTKDAFNALRLVKSLDLKKEAEKVLRDADSTDDIFSNGYALIYTVFEKAVEQNAEKKIYEFLSEPYEMSADEIGNLSIGEQLEKLKTLAKENDLKVFIRDVKKLLNVLK